MLENDKKGIGILLIFIIGLIVLVYSTYFSQCYLKKEFIDFDKKEFQDVWVNFTQVDFNIADLEISKNVLLHNISIQTQNNTYVFPKTITNVKIVGYAINKYGKWLITSRNKISNGIHVIKKGVIKEAIVYPTNKIIKIIEIIEVRDQNTFEIQNNLFELIIMVSFSFSFSLVCTSISEGLRD